jgi:hypothetical protein
MHSLLFAADFHAEGQFEAGVLQFGWGEMSSE